MERCFGPRDLQFATAVSGQIAVAIARSESFSRVSRLAFEDPLTGLANRRAFDDRLTELLDHALPDGRDVAVVLSDLDGLKPTNDTFGHEAGDRRLVAVAAALRAVADARPGALAARVGGDEFAVVLPDADPAAGECAAESLAALLREEDPTATVSSGVAALSLGPRRASELIRLADAAQYRAKRTGPGRVSSATSVLSIPEQAPPGRRRRGAAAAFAFLVPETVTMLRTTLAAAPELERLDAVTAACAQAAGADRWSVSRVRAASVVETLVTGETRRDGFRDQRRFRLHGDAHALADFPATAGLLRDGGGWLCVHVDDEDADAAERALLRDRGQTQCLVATVRGRDDPMVLELYATDPRSPLDAVAPFLDVLLTYATRAP